MRAFLIRAFCVLLPFSAALVAEEPIRREVDFSVSFSIECSKSLDPESRKWVAEDVKKVLALLHEVTPKESNSLFHWDKKEQVSKKAYKILLTTSEDPLAREFKIPREDLRAVMGLTAVRTLANQKIELTTIVFVDNIYTDEAGNTQQNAFVDLTTGLVAQIRGTVEPFLAMDLQGKKHTDIKLPRMTEVEVSKTLIEFIRRLKKTVFWQRFPPGFVVHFNKRLTAELQAIGEE